MRFQAIRLPVSRACTLLLSVITDFALKKTSEKKHKLNVTIDKEDNR